MPIRVVVALVWLFAAVAEARQDSTITVTLLGTGNPRPTPTRSGPATLIEAGDERILIDAGRGTATRLFEIGSASLLSGVTAVLLTHLHSDHVVGLPDVWLTGWLFGRREALQVYGPHGTETHARGLELAYGFDVRLRASDEGLPAAGARLQARDVSPGVVFSRNGVRIIAFEVDHRPVEPAYGFRIEYRKRSVVLSGDTRFTDKVIDASRGADVIIHEVVSPAVERRRAKVQDPAAIERIIQRHTTPEEAGRIFDAVKPRLAVYSHIVPSPASAGDLIAPTRRTYKGPLEVGYDLMQIAVGDRVVVSRRAVLPE